MSHFFTRLVEQTKGMVPLVYPVAPTPRELTDRPLGSDEEANRFWDDIAELETPRAVPTKVNREERPARNETPPPPLPRSNDTARDHKREPRDQAEADDTEGGASGVPESLDPTDVPDSSPTDEPLEFPGNEPGNHDESLPEPPPPLETRQEDTPEPWITPKEAKADGNSEPAHRIASGMDDEPANGGAPFLDPFEASQERRPSRPETSESATRQTKPSHTTTEPGDLKEPSETPHQRPASIEAPVPVDPAPRPASHTEQPRTALDESTISPKASETAQRAAHRPGTRVESKQPAATEALTRTAQPETQEPEQKIPRQPDQITAPLDVTQTRKAETQPTPLSAGTEAQTSPLSQPKVDADTSPSQAPNEPTGLQQAQTEEASSRSTSPDDIPLMAHDTVPEVPPPRVERQERAVPSLDDPFQASEFKAGQPPTTAPTRRGEPVSSNQRPTNQEKPNNAKVGDVTATPDRRPDRQTETPPRQVHTPNPTTGNVPSAGSKTVATTPSRERAIPSANDAASNPATAPKKVEPESRQRQARALAAHPSPQPSHEPTRVRSEGLSANRDMPGKSAALPPESKETPKKEASPTHKATSTTSPAQARTEQAPTVVQPEVVETPGARPSQPASLHPPARETKSATRGHFANGQTDKPTTPESQPNIISTESRSSSQAEQDSLASLSENAESPTPPPLQPRATNDSPDTHPPRMAHPESAARIDDSIRATTPGMPSNTVETRTAVPSQTPTKRDSPAPHASRVSHNPKPAPRQDETMLQESDTRIVPPSQPSMYSLLTHVPEANEPQRVDEPEDHSTTLSTSQAETPVTGEPQAPAPGRHESESAQTTLQREDETRSHQTTPSTLQAESIKADRVRTDETRPAAHPSATVPARGAVSEGDTGERGPTTRLGLEAGESPGLGIDYDPFQATELRRARRPEQPAPSATNRPSQATSTSISRATSHTKQVDKAMPGQTMAEDGLSPRQRAGETTEKATTQARPDHKLQTSRQAKQHTFQEPQPNRRAVPEAPHGAAEERLVGAQPSERTSRERQPGTGSTQNAPLSQPDPESVASAPGMRQPEVVETPIASPSPLPVKADSLATDSDRLAQATETMPRRIEPIRATPKGTQHEVNVSGAAPPSSPDPIQHTSGEQSPSHETRPLTTRRSAAERPVDAHAKQTSSERQPDTISTQTAPISPSNSDSVASAPTMGQPAVAETPIASQSPIAVKADSATTHSDGLAQATEPAPRRDDPIRAMQMVTQHEDLVPGAAPPSLPDPIQHTSDEQPPTHETRPLTIRRSAVERPVDAHAKQTSRERQPDTISTQTAPISQSNSDSVASAPTMGQPAVAETPIASPSLQTKTDSRTTQVTRGSEPARLGMGPIDTATERAQTETVEKPTAAPSLPQARLDTLSSHSSPAAQGPEHAPRGVDPIRAKPSGTLRELADPDALSSPGPSQRFHGEYAPFHGTSPVVTSDSDLWHSGDVHPSEQTSRERQPGTDSKQTAPSSQPKSDPVAPVPTLGQPEAVETPNVPPSHAGDASVSSMPTMIQPKVDETRSTPPPQSEFSQPTSAEHSSSHEVDTTSERFEEIHPKQPSQALPPKTGKSPSIPASSRDQEKTVPPPTMVQPDATSKRGTTLSRSGHDSVASKPANMSPEAQTRSASSQDQTKAVSPASPTPQISQVNEPAPRRDEPVADRPTSRRPEAIEPPSTAQVSQNPDPTPRRDDSIHATPTNTKYESVDSGFAPLSSSDPVQRTSRDLDPEVVATSSVPPSQPGLDSVVSTPTMLAEVVAIPPVPASHSAPAQHSSGERQPSHGTIPGPTHGSALDRSLTVQPATQKARDLQPEVASTSSVPSSQPGLNSVVSAPKMQAEVIAKPPVPASHSGPAQHTSGERPPAHETITVATRGSALDHSVDATPAKRTSPDLQPEIVAMLSVPPSQPDNGSARSTPGMMQPEVVETPPLPRAELGYQPAHSEPAPQDTKARPRKGHPPRVTPKSTEQNATEQPTSHASQPPMKKVTQATHPSRAPQDSKVRPGKDHPNHVKPTRMQDEVVRARSVPNPPSGQPPREDLQPNPQQPNTIVAQNAPTRHAEGDSLISKPVMRQPEVIEATTAPTFQPRTDPVSKTPAPRGDHSIVATPTSMQPGVIESPAAPPSRPRTRTVSPASQSESTPRFSEPMPRDIDPTAVTLSSMQSSVVETPSPTLITPYPQVAPRRDDPNGTAPTSRQHEVIGKQAAPPIKPGPTQHTSREQPPSHGTRATSGSTREYSVNAQPANQASRELHPDTASAQSGPAAQPRHASGSSKPAMKQPDAIESLSAPPSQPHRKAISPTSHSGPATQRLKPARGKDDPNPATPESMQSEVVAKRPVPISQSRPVQRSPGEPRSSHGTTPEPTHGSAFNPSVDATPPKRTSRDVLPEVVAASSVLPSQPGLSVASAPTMPAEVVAKPPVPASHSGPVQRSSGEPRSSQGTIPGPTHGPAFDSSVDATPPKRTSRDVLPEVVARSSVPPSQPGLDSVASPPTMAAEVVENPPVPASHSGPIQRSSGEPRPSHGTIPEPTHGSALARSVDATPPKRTSRDVLPEVVARSSVPPFQPGLDSVASAPTMPAEVVAKPPVPASHSGPVQRSSGEPRPSHGTIPEPTRGTHPAGVHHAPPMQRFADPSVPFDVSASEGTQSGAVPPVEGSAPVRFTSMSLEDLQREGARALRDRAEQYAPAPVSASDQSAQPVDHQPTRVGSTLLATARPTASPQPSAAPTEPKHALAGWRRRSGRIDVSIRKTAPLPSDSPPATTEAPVAPRPRLTVADASDLPSRQSRPLPPRPQLGAFPPSPNSSEVQPAAQPSFSALDGWQRSTAAPRSSSPLLPSPQSEEAAPPDPADRHPQLDAPPRPGLDARDPSPPNKPTLPPSRRDALNQAPVKVNIGRIGVRGFEPPKAPPLVERKVVPPSKSLDSFLSGN